MATVDHTAEAPAGRHTSNPKKPKRKRRIKLPKSKKMLIGLIMLGLFILLAAVGPYVAPYDPQAINSSSSQHPSGGHWLGQTQIGQDVFSQLIAGTRPTVFSSFLAGIIATVLAVIIGLTAGYVGGLVDEVLSLFANVFLVIPALPLLIAIGAFLGPDTAGNPLVVALIIAVTGWAFGARVLRSQTLSLRRRDFVEAARVSGESTWRIIMYEIMPNLTAVIASSFLFTTIYAIGTYVGLGYLHVISAGANYNWGSILYDATSSSAVQAGFWWWYIPPGIAIALLGTALALINFGIDEYINPRLRVATLSRADRKRLGVKLKPQLGFTPVVRRAGAGGGYRTATAGAVEDGR